MSQLCLPERPLEDSLKLARELGQQGAEQGDFSFTLGLGILLNRFARHWLIRKGDYERSLSVSQTAQVLFDTLGAKVNATQTDVEQGVTYQAVGERTAAVGKLEAGMDGYGREMPSQPAIVDNLKQRLLSLGLSLYQLNLQGMDADGMERTAERLQRLVADLPGGSDPRAVLEALVNQMAAMSSSERRASTDLPSGIEFWSLGQAARSVIEQVGVLAPLYRARQAKIGGDVTEVTRNLAAATKALDRVSPDERGLLEVSVLCEQGEYSKAAEVYEASLAQGSAKPGFINTLTEVMQQFGGTQGVAEARLQQRREHEQAFAVFVRCKAYDKALTHTQAIETMAGQDWWKSDAKPWQILSDYGEMHEGLGQLDNALDSYDEAIRQLDARRNQLTRDELKTAIAADKGAQYLYFFAARAAMKRNDAARAFGYAEQAKARALLDLMATSQIDAKALESDAMREWRKLSAQLTLRRGLLAQARAQRDPEPSQIETLSEQVEQDEAALRKAERALARSNPDFHRLISTDAQTLSLADVAEQLPRGMALIEYFFLADDVLVWAIGKSGY